MESRGIKPNRRFSLYLSHERFLKYLLTKYLGSVSVSSLVWSLRGFGLCHFEQKEKEAKVESFKHSGSRRLNL